MNTMPQVVLGTTNVSVSAVGLGTAPLGDLYVSISDAQAVDTVQTAFTQGITLFDTAPFYGAGLSEQRLGMALAGVARDRYVLSSKVGRVIEPTGTVRFDWSRDGVLRSIEGSLQRLRTDRIDVLLVHDPDEHEHEAITTAFPLLVDLRRQGVVRAIGAGMNQWQMLARFVQKADVDCFLLAGRYTLLEQGALPLLALCQQRGIGVLLGGVFNSGILATGAAEGAKYNYEDAPHSVLERVRQIEAICRRYGVALPAAALQFPQAHPAVTALVVGAQSPTQVTTNLEARRSSVPAAAWTELRRAGLVHAAAPVPTT